MEIALIESAESPNRIEGVTVDKNRLKPLVIGKAKPRDRSEEEVAGYRQALDFLCIHPFRDGNGRVSRLLTLLALYQHGFQVGKYISLERIIEQSKETYYESLNKSSQDWHRSKHDCFPWFNYFLGTTLGAYKEFEERAGSLKPARGAKTAIVEMAINRQLGEFTISDIEQACPNVSRVMIKKIFMRTQKAKKIKCLRKGQSAKWTRLS